MNEQAIREEICGIGRRIYERGMVAANDGNISVKVGENEFLCTPTGVSKGFMTPESICRIDAEGKLLEACGDFRPSSEMKMHMRVYQIREDVGAVVHAHPAYATCFAAADIPLSKPVMSEAVVSLGCVPVAPYGTPSTAEVPDGIEPYLPCFDAVLLQNHGALTWAVDLETAYMRMESVEFYARLLYKTEQMGGAKELSPENVEKLYEVRRKMKQPGRHPADLPLHIVKTECRHHCVVCPLTSSRRPL
ncbi:MAG: class II aldolase/adducin family protein [Roseburia sp.]|nr:class II aldolase/adducin family protein [Ruminococcus sp.]MCM1156256.1 class II aldolase/adducin family protein [Roseburia sp.]MCM1243479.1 class II aldolase/adducin family protein [Roseburia sp.]